MLLILKIIRDPEIHIVGGHAQLLNGKVGGTYLAI
jgi:hypothetical protein